MSLSHVSPPTDVEDRGRRTGDNETLLTINGIDELKAHAGEDLGVTGWHDVTQAEIDAFADVTGDHQWIHVDPERARETPFGGTIAHGYYTLSLAPRFLEELLRVDGMGIMINYGLNKLRFPAALPVGDRVRMHLRLAAVDDVSGGVMVTSELTFEREGGGKPVCVAETLTLAYAG
jgi:acyl dehydratase